MIVVAPWSQPINRRHCVPDHIAIAQPAALLITNRNANVLTGLLPKLIQSIGGGIARPGPALRQNFCLDLTRITVGFAAHLPRSRQTQKFPSRVIEYRLSKCA